MPINPKTADNKQQQSSGSRAASNSRAMNSADDLSQDETAHQALAKRLAMLEEVMLDGEQKFPDGSLQSIIFSSLKTIANNITAEQGNSNNSNSRNSSNDNNISEAGLVKLVEQCVQELTTQLNQSPDDKTIQQGGSKLRDYLEDFLTWQASLNNGFPVDIHTYHKILSYVDSKVEATALSLTCKAHYLNTKVHRLPSHLQWLKTPPRNYASPPVGCKDLRGHESAASCLTTLPNGCIVSGSWDKTLKIWNPSTGECVRTLKGHENQVYSLITLPNGFIVSGSYDKPLKIWNPNTGECVNTLEEHEVSFYCLTTLPNGFIVSGGWGEPLKIWNPDTGECVNTLKGHESTVRSLTTLANGFIVSGADDESLKIWNFKRLMPKHDAENIEPKCASENMTQKITRSLRQFLFGNSNSTNSNAGASVNTNINLSTGNTTDNAPNSNHFKRGQP